MVGSLGEMDSGAAELREGGEVGVAWDVKGSSEEPAVGQEGKPMPPLLSEHSPGT